MVKIEFVNMNEDEVTYKYFPEHETEKYGVVTVNKHTLERQIKQKAEGYGNEYAFHACREVERYIEKGKFKTQGMVAWY